MGEFLEGASKVAVLVFVVACMAAAGLGLGIRDVAPPLRRGRLVLLAVVANFILAPGIAYGLTQTVLALGTGQRNVAAARLVATQNFTDPGVAVMILVATLAGLVPLLLAARWFARRSGTGTTGIEHEGVWR